MKYSFLVAICLTVCACSDSTPDANDAELEAAALPENSMEQQSAILEIRARESAIRNAGYPSCADTFAVEAAKKLGLN